MMKRQPFTNAGFQALQNELYQLPDDELQLQADLVLNDFIPWLELHFDLSVSQLAFLDQIDSRMKYSLAHNTSFAIVNRAPIILIKPEASLRTEEKERKIIRDNVTITSSSDEDGDFELDGELIITIEYQDIEN